MSKLQDHKKKNILSCYLSKGGEGSGIYDHHHKSIAKQLTTANTPKIITPKTRLSEIKIGDTLLDGRVITEIKITPSGRYKIAPWFGTALKDAPVCAHFQHYGLTAEQSEERMKAIKS